MGDHTEAIEIAYDPHAISYTELLDVFFAGYVPSTPSWDVQYRWAIWPTDEHQRAVAEARMATEERERGKELYVDIEPARTFFQAEDYHQKYRLRSDRTLAAELVAQHPEDRALVATTAAARLNGWLAGYGTAAQLEAELGGFGLSRGARTKVEQAVGE